ncbi:APC family permease [Pseudomonas nabeulensis]|uniref:APC family permease n=1 Tax=Pseudomonas nabeulensis TaxID=2293833 RepID=A0A4Z0B3T0_9PSED|nr:APC family permease [Pseudomonas nabeulensis]TFY93217.1 APC family permease [Pseudomonas nabeulensis]
MSTDTEHLKRTLGPVSVVLFGLAFIAPLIVFGTYGVIAEASQNTVALSYLVASIGVFFTALSYGRMVRVFPVAGSAYTYTRKMLNANFGFMVGWAALLDYFFIPMLIWLLGASYLALAFPDVPQWCWIAGFIVSTTLLNILGIQIANRFNIFLMLVQISIIVVFIALCWHYVSAANGVGGLLSAKPFFNAQVPFSATMAGAAIAAYSFLGFDALSTLSEETINPKKTIPQAILAVALIGGTVYVGAAYFMYMAHPLPEFANIDGAAFEIAKMIGGDVFFTVVLAGIILAHFAAGLSFQASVGRLLFALGRDNLLPRALFGVLHPRFKTPVFNILLAGAFGFVGLGLTIATATSLVNFGAFLAFTSVNLCALKLTFDKVVGDQPGVFRGVVCPLIGATTSAWMLISLDKDALILGCLWLLLGGLYLAFMTRAFQRPAPEAAL